jgi:hypothetical protein
MDIATLGAGTTPGAIPFRSDAAAGRLAACDAVFVDLDAVLAEFADAIEDRHPTPLLDVGASSALLADARRWREALAAFAATERVILVGWTDTPLARVHTIHDIVPFGLADLFPRIAPQVEGLDADPPITADCGEPFDRFLDALGLPAASRFAVRAPRGETLARTAQGDPTALYVVSGASHVVFAPIAAGPDRAERVHAGIEVLGRALCGARHSTFLPAWARRMELPDEREAREQLEAIEADLAILKRRADAARATLEATRRIKAIVGGSPAQAAAATSERLRIRGANLLRDFEHENGFVSGLDARTTLLLAFAAPGDGTFVARTEAMLARYRHEFDADATPVLVQLPHADGTPAPLAPLRASGHAACAAADLLDTLADETRPLAERMLALVERSKEPRR